MSLHFPPPPPVPLIYTNKQTKRPQNYLETSHLPWFPCHRSPAADFFFLGGITFHRLRPLPLPIGGTASSQGPQDTRKHCALALNSLWVWVGPGLNCCQVRLLVELEVPAAGILPLCFPHFGFWTLGKCCFSSSLDAYMLPKFSLGFDRICENVQDKGTTNQPWPYCQ